MLILRYWMGRLGNNIIQLSNMIDIALEYKVNICLNRPHPLFDVTVIEKYFDKYKCSDNKELVNFFYYKEKLPFPLEIYNNNKQERNKLLYSAFLIKDIEKLHVNDLVIHIRSGDIFSSRPHPNYTPPPLSYYTKEINKHNYSKIIIVCEDTVNPVVNKLLELYKNAYYKKNTLIDDIKIILGATNIIASVGTFISSLMLISNNNENLHTTDCDKENLEKYFEIMKPWLNTQEQRNLILTYNLD